MIRDDGDVSTTTPTAEGTATAASAKSAPGFTAVFVIAGMLNRLRDDAAERVGGSTCDGG